jgi:hypothetical protein
MIWGGGVASARICHLKIVSGGIQAATVPPESHSLHLIYRPLPPHQDTQQGYQQFITSLNISKYTWKRLNITTRME